MTPHTFRNTPLVVGCGIAGGAFVVLFLLLVLADRGASPRGGSASELYLISLVLGLGLLRATRLRVRIDDDGVTARTLVRTTRVGWHDLSGALADTRGLVLFRIEGPPVLVQSLGETALTRVLRSRTGGAAVARAIEDERLRRTRDDGDPDVA